MPSYEVLEPEPAAQRPSRLQLLFDAPGRFLRWLSPGGQLTAWVKWCLTVAITVGLPVVLFVPIITYLLKQLAVWLQALEAACAALFKAVGYLALVLVILYILCAAGKSQSGGRRR